MKNARRLRKAILALSAATVLPLALTGCPKPGDQPAKKEHPAAEHPTKKDHPATEHPAKTESTTKTEHPTTEHPSAEHPSKTEHPK